MTKRERDFWMATYAAARHNLAGHGISGAEGRLRAIAVACLDLKEMRRLLTDEGAREVEGTQLSAESLAMLKEVFDGD